MVRFPDAPRALSGQVDCLLHRRLAQRHERQNIERADARVHAPVRAQVDVFQGCARQRHPRIADRCSRSHGRNDAAVVNDVAGTVNHTRAGVFNTPHASIHHLGAAAFGDVRDNFENLQRYPSEADMAVPMSACFSGVISVV